MVDDGGRVPASDVVTAFTDRLRVRCHRQHHAGPAAARNAGAALASGDWLVFLDDDCQVMPDWLPRLRQHLRHHPEALIGGIAVNTAERGSYAESHQLLVVST